MVQSRRECPMEAAMSNVLVNLIGFATDPKASEQLEQALTLCAEKPSRYLVVEVRDRDEEDHPASGKVDSFDIEGVDFSKYVLTPFFRGLAGPVIPSDLPDEAQCDGEHGGGI